jgi:hypothetical protein
MGLRRFTAVGAALLALAVAGCGGGSGAGDGSDAAQLTKWLPPGSASYRAIDLTAFKDELGLPEDEDPWRGRLGQQGAAPFAVLLPTVKPQESGIVETGESIDGQTFNVPSTAILEAVGPESVTSAATSQSGSGAENVNMSVFATSGDTDEIGSALGDLGYRYDGGVLVKGDRDPAIRLDDGLVFASDSADALRAIPEEPASDYPAKLLGDIGGDDVRVAAYGFECVVESGVGADADGSGRIAFLIDGGAEADRLDPQDALAGDPDVDGDLVTAEVEPGDPGIGAADILALFPRYDCD